MKVKLTNTEKVESFSVFEYLHNQPEKNNPKYNYAVIRNLGLLEKDAQAVIETGRETLKEYDKERIKLCESLSEKTKDGKPIKFNDDREFKIADENRELFDICIKDLQEKYKEILAKSNAFMKENDEVEIYGIPFDTLPVLSVSIMETLLPFITGEPKEK